jgi:hypothetical protein
VTHASFNFINLVSSLVYAIVLPFAAIATTYLYFDLRVAVITTTNFGRRDAYALSARLLTDEVLRSC